MSEARYDNSGNPIKTRYINEERFFAVFLLLCGLGIDQLIGWIWNPDSVITNLFSPYAALVFLFVLISNGLMVSAINKLEGDLSKQEEELKQKKKILRVIIRENDALLLLSPNPDVRRAAKEILE